MFRGDTYVISIKNPNHVSKGVASLTLDGAAVEGNVIAPVGDGAVHQVVVELG
ncbi:N,N'-diacetylchitobiose phosphorylase [compost metagenome]